MMKSLLKKIGFGVSLALMLAGCTSDGSSGASTTTEQTATGVFVGAPVKGLGYESNGVAGLTGSGGTFTYQVGDEVVFKLGDIIIGKADGAPVITLVDLVKTAEPLLDDSVALKETVKLAQFLLSLDDRTNPSQINIPQSIMNDATGTRFVGVNLLKDDLEIIVNEIKPGAALVDVATAADYLAASLEGIGLARHAGEYIAISGKEGKDVELTGLIINIYGSMFGIASNSHNGYYQLNGTVASDGNFTAKVTDYETGKPANIMVIGKSNGKGGVSGTFFTAKGTSETMTDIVSDVVLINTAEFSLQRMTSAVENARLIKPD